MITSEIREYVSVFDAIPYFGGSKVASINYLKQLKRKGININIFTQDKQSWRGNGFSTSSFKEPKSLSTKEYGLGFYSKNIILAGLYLANTIILIIKHRARPTVIIGTSGPGVDAAMYLAAKLFNIRIVQLIHGPVGNSRLSKLLLRHANVVGYLAPESNSISRIIKNCEAPVSAQKPKKKKPHLIEFENGIDQDSWPSASQSRFLFPEIFWAASLLKWKRLDLFQHAFRCAAKKRVMRANIAYIRPKNTLHPVCAKPENAPHVEAIEKPLDIDLYRSRCNIFVSTSECEPFGLSILEALAAGLCVVIPEDGAYWDLKLEHGYNCIKYKPNCSKSLTQALVDLADNMPLTKTIAENGGKISGGYRAEETYRELVLVSFCKPATRLSTVGDRNENF